MSTPYRIVEDDGLEDEVAFAGMLVRLVQYLAEVIKMLGAALTLGPFGIVKEAAHPLQAGGVEGFQNVQGGEQERAGAAGGIEDRDIPHGVPEGAQQLRPLALSDYVFGKLLDIEVQRDEVVDILHLARD